MVASALIPEETPSQVFGSMIDEIMSLGPLQYVVGLCGLLAALAAIMSTTDACLLGTSNVITVDCVVRFNLWSSSEPSHLVWFSKGVDVTVAVICLLLASLVDSISSLASLQFGITMQIMPIFIAGLYTRRPKPVPLFWGCIVGLGTVAGFAITGAGLCLITKALARIYIYDVLLHYNPSLAMSCNAMQAPWGVLSGVWGIGANVLVTTILYAVDLPCLNSHMCPALSFDAICLLMEGVDEPIFMFKGPHNPMSQLYH